MTNRPRIQTALPYALLALTALALYARTTGFDFIPTWDDDQYVLENPYIRGIGLDNLRAIFSTSFCGNYAPVHILSYMADHMLWGTKAWGYHLTNVLLHAANACLAFHVLVGMTGRPGAAFMAAMLFAVHPVNVENVAWVTERKTMLASLFAMLAAAEYIKDVPARAGRVTVVIVLYALAVFSKVSVAPLPLALIGYDLLIRKQRPAWRIVVPMLIVAAAGAASVMAVHAQHQYLGASSISPRLIAGVIVPTMLPVLWKYIGMLALPVNQSAFYWTQVYGSYAAWPVLASLAALAGVAALALWRGSTQTKFWLLWFALWMLPVSNIVPLQVYYADRYMYTPALGLFVLCALAVDRLIERMPAARKALYAGVALLLAVYAVAAFNRSEVWQNDLALWQDAVRKSPMAQTPHVNLGAVYERMGMYSEAEAEYMRALAIAPTDDVRMNLMVLREKIRMASPK